MDELAGAASVEQVVVAPVTSLTVIGHVDIEADIIPSDVIGDLNFYRAAFDSNQVSGCRIQRVRDDANVSVSRHLNSDRRIAIDLVVGDQLPTAGCNTCAI